MIEKRKQTLDKDEKVGTIIMDLCKVFDTLNQLITSLANGFRLFFQCDTKFVSTFSKGKFIKCFH